MTVERWLLISVATPARFRSWQGLRGACVEPGGGAERRFFPCPDARTGGFDWPPRRDPLLVRRPRVRLWSTRSGLISNGHGARFLVARVLLLNATFEPLQLVSERRAVVLMLAGRAEAIAMPDEPEVCRSSSLVIEIPAIVRLHDMVKLPSKIRTPPLTRRSLLLRDSYRCAYCLEHADTIDHVVPRSRGGRHEWTNVVAACRRHNMQKGDRLLEEIGWRMHFEPRVPDGPWWRWRHVPDPDPLWAPYLPRAS